MWKRTAIANLCLWLAACGGDDVDPPGMDPDAAMPAASDGGAPGPDAGEMPPDAAPPDAASQEPDGGPTGPTIESVETSEGYTQVRQGSTIELVITGAHLGGVMSVRVGQFEATGVEATDGEVRAQLAVAHATEPGPRDVAVSGLDGSAAARSAIGVTPYVVAPSLPSDGHGTFQSPISLCGTQISTSQRGDTILLLAGQHQCRFPIDLGRGGQLIQGQGEGTTIVGGAEGRFGGFRLVRPLPFPVATMFRDLTIDARLPDDGAIRLVERGALIMERVTIMSSVISLGECAICPTRATIQDSTFIDGGIVASGDAQIRVTGSTVTGEGIRTSGGGLTVTETTFDGCSTGVELQSGGDLRVGLRGEITDSTFTDCETGVILGRGSLAVTGTTIRGLTPFSSLRGILIASGNLEARGVTITGQEISGIEAVVGTIDDPSVLVTLIDALIEGGQYGVRLHGGDARFGGLRMSSSIVRDQTVAAVSLGFRRMDTYDLRGGNQLSVVSGVALEDALVDPMFITPVQAAGIRLNGKPQSGLIPGPIDRSPDFRIVDPRRSIQF